MNEQTLRHIGIQFFAESGDDGAAGGGAAEGSPGENTGAQGGAGGNTGGGNSGGGTAGGKTYTQEEVNRMLANEKRQGRQSILKDLGLDPADKDAAKKAREILDAQKTQAEKDADALKAEKSARAEAEEKATAAERKLEVISAGCRKDFVDEVTALAAVKVTDKVDFKAAVQLVKDKCPAFFEDEGDTGTGSGQGHKRQKTDDKPGSFGTRLAQGFVSSNVKENPYFKT